MRWLYFQCGHTDCVNFINVKPEPSTQKEIYKMQLVRGTLFKLLTENRPLQGRLSLSLIFSISTTSGLWQSH